MKKFTEYKCDTCKRTNVIENDTRRFFIPKCNITLGCTGKLVPIGESNTKDVVSIKPVAGLEDWRARGTTSEYAPEIIPEKFILLSNGPSNEIVLAVKSSLAQGSTITATFNVVKNRSTSFKEYTYTRLAPITQVNGLDDTPDKKLLRFSLTDEIRVFVNGIEKIESVDWTRNALTHTISFITTLVEDSTIVITVAPQQAVTTKILIFTKNTLGAFIDTAWGNVETIKIGGTSGQDYDVYTCPSVELDIDINTSLTLTSLNGTSNINLEDALFLLSNKPWSYIDRVFTYYGDCGKIMNNVADIKMTKIDNELQIQISEYGISDIFPQIICSSIFANEELEDSDKAGIDFLQTYNNQNILGPV